MKFIKQINIQKSIQRKWLFYKESVSDKIDLIINLAIPISLIFAAYVTIKSQNSFNENERFYIYIMGFVAAFATFVAFKKLTEKRLKVIETKNSKEQNSLLLKSIARKNNWLEVKSVSGAEIYYNNSEDFKTYINIFLLAENKIYYTVLTERFRLNYPTLTENSLIKNLIQTELKK